MEYINISITKEVLDSIKVGDFLRCNEWKRAMKVKATSNNYILISSNAFGKTLYAVLEKIPFKGIQYNNLKGGFFSVGTDNTIFGDDLEYKFDNSEVCNKYLEKFESKQLELSMRNSCALWEINIK